MKDHKSVVTGRCENGMPHLLGGGTPGECHDCAEADRKAKDARIAELEDSIAFYQRQRGPDRQTIEEQQREIELKDGEIQKLTAQRDAVLRWSAHPRFYAGAKEYGDGYEAAAAEVRRIYTESP